MTQQDDTAERFYFPPRGQGVEFQDIRSPEALGLLPETISHIDDFVQERPLLGRVKTPRWALWRHGYLMHVEGDFNATIDVASLRKTWHAMIVGAAIKQGKIPSYHQKRSVFGRQR